MQSGEIAPESERISLKTVGNFAVQNVYSTLEIVGMPSFLRCSHYIT